MGGYEAGQSGQALSATSQPVTIEFVSNPDYATTNNIVSLRLGLRSLNETYQGDLLLIECDVVLDDDVLLRLVADPAPDVSVVASEAEDKAKDRDKDK